MTSRSVREESNFVEETSEISKEQVFLNCRPFSNCKFMRLKTSSHAAIYVIQYFRLFPGGYFHIKRSREGVNPRICLQTSCQNPKFCLQKFR